MILLLPTCVYAVGISGYDLDIEAEFKPNTRFRFEFIGIANKLFDGLDYKVYGHGGLEDYLEFEQKVFEDVEQGSKVPIIGYINFPESLPPPQQGLMVCFEEECPEQGAMCGKTAACATVSVKVPYEGKYPVVSLRAGSVNENDPVVFKATIKNVGDTTIDSCKGFVEIFDIRDKRIGSVQFDTTESIEPFKRRTTENSFNTVGVPPGNYSAEAVIDCDGIEKNADAEFRIGTLDVKIIGYPEEIESGGIKKFVTTVESVWNDPISVYGEISIRGDGQRVNAKTATYMLDPWKTLDMEAFIDTTELEEKEYDLDIDVSYQGRKSSVSDRIQVVAPSGTEPAEEEVPAKEGGISTTTLTVILVIVVILLTLVNIFLAVYRKKKD